MNNQSNEAKSVKEQNIVKSNGTYRFFNKIEIIKTLEVKNYFLDWDSFGNVWLKEAETEKFIFPDKIYDIDSSFREMVKTSWENSKKNLGVLLTGQKGQGKSLTAKLLCEEIGKPVIMISQSVPEGVNFISFLTQIEQDFVLYIDEFEKLFTVKRDNETGEHSQEVFLSFMDGILMKENKILFLLTTNDSVNEFLLCRPSRVKWLKPYDEMPEEVFDMITEDLLNNKGFAEDLKDTVSLLNLNVDSLISIINDINLFNKPFSEFAKFYNYQPETYSYQLEIKIGETGNYVFKEFKHENKKIKQKDRHMCDHGVVKLIKFTADEIEFRTNDHWDYKTTGTGKNRKEEETYTPQYVRLTPSKITNYSAAAI